MFVSKQSSPAHMILSTILIGFWSFNMMDLVVSAAFAAVCSAFFRDQLKTQFAPWEKTFHKVSMRKIDAAIYSIVGSSKLAKNKINCFSKGDEAPRE
jgi:undecaprenyl pyrophosphate phosphatase UppP